MAKDYREPWEIKFNTKMKSAGFTRREANSTSYWFKLVQTDGDRMALAIKSLVAGVDVHDVSINSKVVEPELLEYLRHKWSEDKAEQEKVFEPVACKELPSEISLKMLSSTQLFNSNMHLFKEVKQVWGKNAGTTYQVYGVVMSELAADIYIHMFAQEGEGKAEFIGVRHFNIQKKELEQGFYYLIDLDKRVQRQARKMQREIDNNKDK